MFDPASHHALTARQAEMVRHIVSFTRRYFQNPKFDASHDFRHVLRVTALAVHILDQEQTMRQRRSWPPYDSFIVIMGALLHDVDDKKYITTQSHLPQAQQELLRIGVQPEAAFKIQALVEGVSYSSEAKNPQRVRDLLVTIPELAVVQDADRLDAIGAIGIGRCFTYGAVKGGGARDMNETLDHFEDKLLRVEKMTKTDTGRKLAAARTQRLKQFQSWWNEESNFAGQIS